MKTTETTRAVAQRHRPYSLRRLLLILLLVSLRAISAPNQLPAPLRLSSGWELQDEARLTDKGEAISRTDYRPANWHRATVPGTVLTSLVNDGVYPEPLYGENNRPDKIPDTLCRTAYWYRTVFTPPTSFAGRQIWLNFNGINYIADVWVNGRQLGTIKGAFTRGIFDVTSQVNVGHPNAIAVRIQPQPHPGETHEKTIAKGTGLNGGVTGLDGPTFLCSIGWDWIPTIRDRNSGIWQDVTLSATGPVVIKDPYVTTHLPLPHTDTADVIIEATVRNVTDVAQKGMLSGTIGRITFEQPVSLAPNEARSLVFSPSNTPALRVKNPRLWWPNGYGPQNLYSLHLAFSANTVVSDTSDFNFGIRQISYTVPGSSNLTLSVNGVPVFAKGGDWGIDEAMKRIPLKRLNAAVRMHQLANYTMIRNWVGQSTSAALYDLCDQYGILLWDEFFEPHPADGPVPEDVGLYLANVRDKILRFRNHPSIALWCARNEGDPPPAIGQGIQKLITSLDPGRLYQPSSTSGRGVNSGGPYHWRTPREFYTYSEAFKTEVGSVSVPILEAIKAMMPSNDWEVVNDDWAEHDFCSGAQQGDLYPQIITTRFGRPANLPDFVRKSQLANYECFRAMYEGRFARLFNPVTGVITWMSHPAQPSFVWQLYSHDLEPNSSLFATRKACEPVHIQMNQNNWHVMLINNTPNVLAGMEVKTLVYALDGKLKYSHSDIVAAPGSTAKDIGAIDFPKSLSPVHFVKLELRDPRSNLVSENFYWRADPQHEDDFRALTTLPMVTLDIQASRYDVGHDCVLEVSVQNPSRSIALMGHLQLRKDRSGDRVLPVFYSDNYLSLLPGERKSLTVDVAAADLGGEQPVLAVDGWNVTVKPLASSGKRVGVIPNTAAQVQTEPNAKPVDSVETIRINCGGSQLGFFRFGPPPPPEEFVGDSYFDGGDTFLAKNRIDAQVPNAAPVEIYQSERRGPCTYVIPVKKGGAYNVRLHFAELRFSPGARKFNVDINGQRVLSDLDIAAEAGKQKALVKDFSSITSNSNGQIVIALSRGSAQDPVICGIEVLK
jgi:hypothetical protein